MVGPISGVSIACYEENITQIHTRGNDMVGPISGNFSMETLFTAFTALPGLKVLSLVSLGLWGPLPHTIANLSSLEILNLSSNQLNGSIPVEMLALKNLQTVVLDHNNLVGEVPFWVGSLSGLTILSLKNNSLSGLLPKSLGLLENLRILQLSMNQLNGEVPDLSNLTNLQVLDLGNNSLGPKFPSLHNKLVTLVLRKNRFKFGMTDDLNSFYQLEKLDISANEYLGPFPSSLLSLPLIGYLNIAGNKFHGMLQENMSCGSELNFVDLSYNFLTGDLPACLKSGVKKRVVKYRGNCLSNGGKRQRQNPYPLCLNEALAVKILPHKKNGNRPSSKVVVAMSIVGGSSLAGLMVLGVGLAFSKHAFKKPQTRTILEKAASMNPSKLFTDAREICQMAKLGPLGLPAYRNYHLDEIKEATENFNMSNLIGEGSHGPVHKGIIGNDNAAAIRSLKLRKRRGVQAYTHHIELLSKLRHVHLVSALGHCFEYHSEDSTVSRVYLIFEFVPNGTLRDFIAGQKPSWSQRIAAAVEVAKGIQFLQTGIMPGLYSNDIKITDVLLDNNLHVKLNSYNLPLLAENKETIDMGLIPSGSKENCGALSNQQEKSDVYDFGVILMEMIAGRAIVSLNDVSVVKDLFQVGINADKIARKQVIDASILKEYSDNSVKILMELCVRSVSVQQNDRPSIDDVLWNLQFAAQVQDSCQGDCPSDRSSPIFTSQ
ncbi:hypothetical protein KSS87_011291 [Heliosperma pusillum]|nr:hypothetical protein KSS87_011291 [Heliosperma pusillum]